MKRYMIMAILLLACTDEAGSRNALESMGFTDIHLDGWAPIGCGKDDTFSTEFHAKNPQGRQVSGVVCCGAWKNCTVRF